MGVVPLGWLLFLLKTPKRQPIVIVVARCSSRVDGGRTLESTTTQLERELERLKRTYDLVALLPGFNAFRGLSLKCQVKRTKGERTYYEGADLHYDNQGRCRHIGRYYMLGGGRHLEIDSQDFAFDD